MNTYLYNVFKLLIDLQNYIQFTRLLSHDIKNFWDQYVFFYGYLTMLTVLKNYIELENIIRN